MPVWLFVLLSLIGILFLYQIASGVIAIVLFGFRLEVTAENKTAFRLVQTLGQFLFLLIPTLVLAKLRFPSIANFFRIRRIRLLEIIIVLISSFALQQISIGYMLLQQAIPIEPPTFIKEINELAEQLVKSLTSSDSFGEFLFVVVVVALTPAICEEVLFRGLVQRTLGDLSSDHDPISMSKSGLRAAIISGLIFGLFHLNITQFIPLAALGVYFGFVVYRTQNIVTSMVAHFFNNFLACLGVYLNLDDEFIAVSPTGQPSSMMLALNFVLCAVVFVAATYYLVRITNRTDVQPAEQAPD